MDGSHEPSAFIAAGWECVRGRVLTANCEVIVLLEEHSVKHNGSEKTRAVVVVMKGS